MRESAGMEGKSSSLKVRFGGISVESSANGTFYIDFLHFTTGIFYPRSALTGFSESIQ